jgi:ketosteroid isomerase-like protein
VPRENSEVVRQQNIEIVRELYARVLAGELPPVSGRWHDDAEWHNAIDPDQTVLRGLPAIASGMREFEDTFPDIRSEILSIDGRDDEVAVWVKMTGSGRHSGVSVAREVAYVWTLRQGKVARVVEYVGYDEALKAVGLEG